MARAPTGSAPRWPWPWPRVASTPRHRPGRHVRRRPGVRGRRPAVPARLHRHGQGATPTRSPPSWPGCTRGAGRRAARCVGGETAEHAGVMVTRRARSGRLRRRRRRAGDPARPRAGARRAADVVVGIPSPGLRSNGYTLARHVLLERAGLELDDPAWTGLASGSGSAWGAPGAQRGGRAVAAIGDLRTRRAWRRTPPARRLAARLRPHHGRRDRGQPPPGAPRGPRRGAGPLGLGGAPHLRRDPAAGRGGGGRDGPGVQPAASAWHW